MNDQPYQNRELDVRFVEIKDQLDRIEGQTRKTNGRVSNLENWRWFLSGGFALTTVLIIPVLIALLIHRA